MNTSNPQSERVERALLSLDGLSVGDAFGQMLSARARSARSVVGRGGLPSGPWWHTDDTQMAMAVVDELIAHGQIATDSLARRFAERYQVDPGRGYGKGARLQLEEVARGGDWRATSASAFGGKGSMGNGAAMRAAPLGAWFADDYSKVVSEGTLSSVVTHSHPEGIAGCIAVAVGAAAAWRSRDTSLPDACEAIWEAVLRHTPSGETWDGLQKARAVPHEMAPENAARILGSGYLVTAPDTVPFALWCAIRHLNDYPEALLSTLEGDGDCDTNCAIVGGIVALRTGREGIPAEWLASREPLNTRLPERHQYRPQP